MSVFLSFGKDVDANYQHIDSQMSGRGDLCCPFCDCPLIAVKGTKKAAHFRHDGETCNESLNEIPQIEGWHHFHLNYPLVVVDALRKGYNSTAKSPNTFQSWNSRVTDIPESYRHTLLKKDEYNSHYVFTDDSRVIVGSMTLIGFSGWMRNKLRTRVSELQQQTKGGERSKAWFEIEAHRQQAILSASLYLFEFKLEDGQALYKVGRTQRDTAERLTETRYDVEKALSLKVTEAKVLREVHQSGHVEQYVFHRYKAHLADVGHHTEYLQLDNKTASKIKAEFTKLANNIEPFTKEEKYIVTGRWSYEEKRLAASKRGVVLTLREGGKFGRPKGTTLVKDDLLKKHKDIVDLLDYFSLSEIAKRTGKSRSTVKRVKAAKG